MLAARMALYDIDDVEAFCRAALDEHLATGKRRRDGSSTMPAQLSAADYEDALAYLVSTVWEASEQFNPIDDGRGTNRFSGYAITIIHWRIVDWKRTRWRSTRYHAGIVEELTGDERDLIATFVDFTTAEVLDLVNSIELAGDEDEQHRDTLHKIVVPMVLEEQTIEDFAIRSGIGVKAIRQRLGRLRRRLETTDLLAA